MTSHKPHPDLAGPLYGKDPWPLRFHSHGFSAACFNTLACSIVYNRHQFGTRKLGHDAGYYDEPSGPPPSHSWRDELSGSHGIVPVDGKTFPGPVDIEWTSLDGCSHAATIDLDEMFKDRLVFAQSIPGRSKGGMACHRFDRPGESEPFGRSK